MAGRRLLDVAALFKASRGVFQKHATLRSRQLEIYSQTSTLAHAIRNQTDRVTETIRAASFLASRLNEEGPTWTTDERAKTEEGDSIPNANSTTGPQRPKHTEGVDHDHFYQASVEDSTANEPPTAELRVQQVKAAHPLPDGTIPPSQSSFQTQTVDQDTVLETPQNEPSKEPLNNDGMEPVSSGESTVPRLAHDPCYATTGKSIQHQPETQIPSRTADALEHRALDPLTDGHDKDSFYQYSTQSSASPVLSSLPGEKLPKHTSNVQQEDSLLLDGSLNLESFYNVEESKSLSSARAVSEQEHIPEGIVTDLFHSPRVARLLGGRLQTRKRGEPRSQDARQAPMGSPAAGAEKGQDISIDGKRIEGNSINVTGGNVSPSDAVSPHEAAQIEAHDVPSLEPYELRESKVPATRLSRIWNYGGLAVGMFGGAISESLRRVGGSEGHGSYMLSAGNMDRLVTKLSRMRGAALKLGQMISFQDSKMLPQPIQEVLQRVQDRADYMPSSQRDKVLTANLGPDWRSLFAVFDEKPIAAASIGQVHNAVLKSDGARVAVKIQYPGVADSINSDLSNLGILLTASRLLPKGLYLDKTIANARRELAWECDYLREAECGRRFERLLADEKSIFVVPRVYPEASGKQVLTMEFMDGVGVTKVKTFSQEQKDWIGTQILRLCLREITEFRFMQTDPNWTNFLYNARTNKLELLDFGASRDYPDKFISTYTKLLAAASRTNRQSVRELSVELGYLTGQESTAMVNAHVASVLTLAEPFLDSSPEVYDFKDQTITDRVKEQIPLMIRERLSPPPEETYSLHRKLSGAFLLCARLGSRVRCRELFQKSMSKGGIL
jgi:aarF domain-containing kinase